jgi:putative membrane protein
MDLSQRARIDPLLFFKGVVMGIANIIPGVSGGTIAVVLGIYDQLIAAISGMFRTRANRTAHVVFLAHVAGGALLAVVVLATLMDFLYEQYMYPTVFFFMGLIIGSIPMIYRQHTQMRPTFVHAACLLAGIISVIALSLLAPDSGTQVTGNGGMALLFVAGIIAAAAMIVPGFSGSFVLVAMGVYWRLIDAVNHLDIVTLIPPVIGGVVGIVFVSRGIEVVLRRYPTKFYYFIIGLLIASVWKLYPGLPSGTLVIVSALTLVVGAVIARSLAE